MTSTTQTQSYYLEPEKESQWKIIAKKSSKLVLSVLQVVVVVAIIGMVSYFFITPFNQVRGRSMQPNFCDRDLYITYKLSSYFSAQPYKLGDVLSFRLNANENLIKRIVGLPGDTLELIDGKIYRNGVMLNEPYLPLGRITEPENYDYLGSAPYIVPEGKLFVVGDNRQNSLDSREFGPIDPKVNTINGNVILVVWPPERVRIFNNNQVFEENICEV